jgi:hypothetical protein
MVLRTNVPTSLSQYIRNGGAKKAIQQYFAYVVDSISRLSISCISRNRQLKVERMLVLFNLGVDTT